MDEYLEPGSVIVGAAIPNREVFASIAISLKRIADMMAADQADLAALDAAFSNTGGA